MNENGNPVWLKDGSFLWFSERTGFKHLYRYRAATATADTARSRRAAGMCGRFYGVDEASSARYFSSARAEPDRHGHLPHRARWHRDLTRLSQAAARTARSSIPTSRATWTCGATSQRRRRCGCTSPTAPKSASIDAQRGSGARRISAVDAGVRAGEDARRIRHGRHAASSRRTSIRRAATRSTSSPTPAPARRRCANRGAVATYMFHQMLAQHGVVVWVLDNRSASGKGAESQWPVYGRLGEMRAAGPRRRRRLAEAAAVRRRRRDRAERLELRRLHDRVCADAQHQLVGRDRRRARDRLARLRLGLHRAADEAAEEQPGRLSAHRTALRRGSTCRRECCSFTGPWTTTSTCRTRCSSPTSCRRRGSRSR